MPLPDAILPAPFGRLGLNIAAGHLTRLEFLPPDSPVQTGADPRIAAPLLAEVAAQLARYFNHPGHRFELPIHLTGSDFRRRVWQALLDIPCGETRSYGELARRLGSSARAVGQALGDNPVPIVIPCHRVIAADGRLGGFNHNGGGFSLDIKRWLLCHEGAL